MSGNNNKVHVLAKQNMSSQEHIAQPGAISMDGKPNSLVSKVDALEDDTSCHPLATTLGCLCFPATLCCSWFTLEPNEEAVVLQFGKYAQTVKDDGIHFFNCFGRDVRRISTRQISYDLPNTKVLDRDGSPLSISAVVVYRIVRPKRALLSVQNVHAFIIQQAEVSLKQTVCRFPYEARDRGDGSHEPCLKLEAAEVSAVLVRTLQEKVDSAGAEIISFMLNELSYAPEIAQSMLKRQQAGALVAARTTVVEGAVGICTQAVDDLEKKGIVMTDAEKTKIVTNLLTVIAGEQEARTVLPL